MKKITLVVFASIFFFYACKKDSSSGGTNTGSNSDTISSNIVFYGMTNSGPGGSSDSGVIFTIKGDGSGYKTIYSFNNISGYAPRGSLCLAPNGKLYGVTLSGGPNDIGYGGGSVFSFNPNGNIFNKIVYLGVDPVTNVVTNGAAVSSTMVLAPDGKLYGINADNIFSVDPSTDQYSIQYKFNQHPDGYDPFAGALIVGSDGKLYGATTYDGESSPIAFGTLYSFDINTKNYAVVHQFDLVSNMGYQPLGTIYEASDGNIYGTTYMTYGFGFTGSSFFKFNISSKAFTQILSFTGANGSSSNLNNNVIQVPGTTKLYGTVSAGGANNMGVLFSYDINSQAYNIVHSFGGTLTNGNADGSTIDGSLIQATDKMLYGITATGGANNSGVIFRFNPKDSSYI